MAVSGRKFGGFKDSLSIGCDEDFDICCDPCKHLGRSLEAKGFCVNCQENLCKRCVDGHKGLKLCRFHRILDQPQHVPPKTTPATNDSMICTEYCDIHKKEIIKFFCEEHDQVGCSDCMTLDHRTCRIDYIPDICSGTLKSNEFGGALQKLSATINEADSVLQISQGKKDEIKRNTEALLKEIEKYQKKINDRIEQLKQQLVEKAKSHKTKRYQKVDKVADICAGVSSELKQIHGVLLDCQAKKFDAQAFVTMKRACSILNITNIQTYKNEVTSVSTNILFEPNDQLENILTQSNALGRLTLNGLDDINPASHIETRVITEKEKNIDIHLMTRMNNIKLKKKRKDDDCAISGCAVISADRLLLADFNNYKLTVVNIDTHSVVEEMDLDNYPWDITLLPQDQVAVTLPDDQKILILGTSGKLLRIRSLRVGRKCWGIVYHDYYLYVLCEAPDSLLVLDMRGNIQRDIELKAALDQTFSNPLYIAVGKDGQTMYISDWKSHIVTSLTLQGQVTGVYKHEELSTPRRMVALKDGSILVCCESSGTIHHVSADLNQGRTLMTGVPAAWSICYHAVNSQIYVGSDDCNKIKVFRIL